jgi:hypothetical protein
VTLTRIDFKAAAAKLDQDKKSAEQNGTYNAVAFDKKVIDGIKLLFLGAEDIQAQYYRIVDKNYAVAKKEIETVEKLVKSKGKKLTDGDLKVIATSVRSIERCSEAIGDFSGQMFAALDQFRGAFATNFRPLLSNPDDVKQFLDRRSAGMAADKERDSLKKRIEQYAERAKDMSKAGQQLATKGAALGASAAQEIQGFVTDFAKAKLDYETFAQKARNSLTQLEQLNPKQKPADMPMAEQRFLNGTKEAKNARGTLKTMNVKLATFKKIGARFTDETLKTATDAYKKAAAELKTAEAAAKKLDTSETKATKIMIAVRKLR